MSNPTRMKSLAVGMGLVLLVALCAQAQTVPAMMSYQGRLTANGTNFNGTGYFKFALVSADGMTTYWSNDGSFPVQVPVSNGLFSVMLGDTWLPMMASIDPTTFQYGHSDAHLRIWFCETEDGTFEQLLPDQPLGSVAYAMMAAKVGTAAIGSMELANDSVTVNKLENNAVNASKLANNAVTSNKIADDAVTSNKLATGSVTTDKIADGTIGEADLSPTLQSNVFWRLGGNAGTQIGFQFVGTLDEEPMEFKVNFQRALRLQYSEYVEEPVEQWDGAPNIIAGSPNNRIDNGAGGSMIGGGYYNHTESNAHYSAIGGGYNNVIWGPYAAIPGGRDNLATNYAFAAGRQAKAKHTGAFVWGDSTEADIVSTNNNSVTMRAYGGYRLFTGAGTLGAQLPPGSSSWSTLSDRAAKENFEPINAGEILAKVAALPVTAWNYKDDPEKRRYIGPVAQDFHAAFGLGNDTSINTLDTDGVTLAAIQALSQRMAALEAENAELKARLERIEAVLAP